MAQDYISNLIGVKVGDRFICYSRYGSREKIVICTKVTPKFADIGGSRYVIATGEGWGGSPYDRPRSLMPYSQKRADRIMEQERHLRQADELNRRDFIALPIALVDSIHEQIRTYETSIAKLLKDGAV